MEQQEFDKETKNIIKTMMGDRGEQYKESQTKSEWERKTEREIGQHEEYKVMNKGLKEKANKTNEVVLITIEEVKEQEKRILYMMDEFSAYVMVEIVHSKRPETIRKAFNQ